MNDTSPVRSTDYVIVGAGSAGAVLANRLSEDPEVSVTLLEAGGEARSFLVQMPVGFARMLTNARFDWCYEQEPDASINDRRFTWSAGKMLGGGSSLNGQVWIRGARSDFNHWAEMGAHGWSWDEVLPFFMRSERWQGPPSQGRGLTGPINVTPIRDSHPLCEAFLAACAEFGLARQEDYNCGTLDGAFLTQASQRDGWRCSTEKGYLRPARNRPNLEVVTGAEVDIVRIADGRAVGVTFKRGAAVERVDARREVILSCGTLGTPGVLMRSGIGPGAYLQARGISVVHDLPGVGRNLQEHSGSSQSKFVNRRTLNSELRAWPMVRDMARFLWNRNGPMGAPAVQAMGFARTEPGLLEPDIQLHFLPLAYDVEPDTLSAAVAKMPTEPCVSINATLCRPKARGHVELAADGRPKAVHQLLGEEDDLERHVRAMKLVDRLFAQNAFAGIVIGDRQPPRPPAGDEEWIAYARAKTLLAYHPVGTCRMGSDRAAVVDPQLRLCGIDGLRVVDASVMPNLPSGNTNAAVIMIGEKAAEAIRTG